jgi:peptidoglycan/LPS O-acetylase OafA/YrhL
MTQTIEEKSAPKAAARLDGVDGLRGVASLAIVTHHMYGGCDLPPLRIHGVNIFRPLDDFPSGVDLFLVLSGFCLFWPYARDAGRRFDYADFLRRRCWRILPAYYVSLLIVPALYQIIWNHLHMYGMTNWPHGWLDVVLHLTLLHTVYYKTFWGWTSASWNLGLEWQWYLAFPIAIWLFRRCGPFVAVAILAVLSVAYHGAVLMAIGHPANLPLDKFVTYREMIPGRLVEFGLGMLAAWWLANRTVSRNLMRGMLLAIPVGLVLGHYGLPVDLMYGSRGIIYAATFSLVMLAAVAPLHNPVAALCSIKPIRLAGQASFSIYLFHLPFVTLICKEMQHHVHSNVKAFFLSLLFIPVIVLIARLSYHTLEEPFMKHTKPAKPKPSPAPVAAEGA